MHGKDLRQVALEKIKALANLPELVWERLATIVGGSTSVNDLRHSCLYAALRGGAFAEMDCFNCLTCVPYSLTQGDIPANVAAIVRKDETDLVDETSLENKKGTTMGIHGGVYVDALTTLEKASCTSYQVECGHALGAKLHLHRPHSFFDAMRDRTTAMALNPLVVKPPLVRQLERLDARLERIPRKNPKKSSVDAPRCKTQGTGPR